MQLPELQHHRNIVWSHHPFGEGKCPVVPLVFKNKTEMIRKTVKSLLTHCFYEGKSIFEFVLSCPK